MDVLTKKQRSFNMSQIKGSNTKPELLLKKFIHDLGIIFVENMSSLPGKPDIYIPCLNLVIQMHGCFWHGHSACRFFTMPKSNSKFWEEKINKNIERDRKAFNRLRDLNLNICVIWECEMKNGDFLEKILNVFNSIPLNLKK